MSNPTDPPLHVEIRELPVIHVAFVSYDLHDTAGNFSEQIRTGFEQIKALVVQAGYDLSTLKVIGVPLVEDNQLTSYDCCIELPAAMSVDGLRTKQLPGGRYAVLSIEKDSARIGAAIGRFFAEYVPQHQLAIDSERPGYEYYYDRVMDFCVPIR